jgi:hypothetical protein
VLSKGSLVDSFRSDTHNGQTETPLARGLSGVSPVRGKELGADEVRQHESSGLFSPFTSSPLIKSWIRIFFEFAQQKLHAFGMAVLVAASPPVRRRRG